MIETPHALLDRYGLRARRSLGQNFLVDPALPERIVAHAELPSCATVLEVGAGLGAMTAALSRVAARVIAVETDPELVTVLHETLAETSNIEIVAGDILKLDPAVLMGSAAPQELPLWGALMPDYFVVANLPYYITAAVLRHLLEASVRPARMVVTVQREVGQRMIARPGDMSLLAVSVQFYAQPRICMRLKPGAFYPAPAVESVVVRLDSHRDPPVAVDDVSAFFGVVKAGFSQKRKQLRNTLAGALHLDPLVVASALESGGVASTRRAETLAIAEWGQVYAALRQWV